MIISWSITEVIHYTVSLLPLSIPYPLLCLQYYHPFPPLPDWAVSRSVLEPLDFTCGQTRLGTSPQRSFTEPDEDYENLEFLGFHQGCAFRYLVARYARGSFPGHFIQHRSLRAVHSHDAPTPKSPRY